MRSPHSSDAPAGGLVALTMGACGGGRADKAGGAAHPGPVVLTLATNNALMPDQIDGFPAGRAALRGRRCGSTPTNWRQGEPGQEKGLVEDVQAGKVDMAWVGARAFDASG